MRSQSKTLRNTTEDSAVPRTKILHWLDRSTGGNPVSECSNCVSLCAWHTGTVSEYLSDLYAPATSRPSHYIRSPHALFAGVYSIIAINPLRAPVKLSACGGRAF